MRSSLLWDVTQRRFVATDFSGQPFGPVFQGSRGSRKILCYFQDEHILITRTMGIAALSNILSIHLHWALSHPGEKKIHSKAGQSHSVHLGRQKNSCPCQESNPTHPANCQTHCLSTIDGWCTSTQEHTQTKTTAGWRPVRSGHLVL
jgi:hypothetical protein